MSSFEGVLGTSDGCEQGVDLSPQRPQADPAGARRPDPAQRVGRLIDALEGEIIPRLMLVHSAPISGRTGDHAAAGSSETARLSDREVLEFTRLLLSHDTSVALAYARTLHAGGVSISAIYLELLTPAARRLGQMWETDECSFADVTLGLCRLHQLLRELGPAFRGHDRVRGERRCALLLPAPGEQHMFGVLMVAEFFRRAGWDVSSGPAESGEGLALRVREKWFSVAGLSVSGERPLGDLSAHVRRLRDASRNPDIAVLVGGRVFVDHPELVAAVGADGTGRDASAATLQAENLLAMIQ